MHDRIFVGAVLVFAVVSLVVLLFGLGGTDGS